MKKLDPPLLSIVNHGLVPI